MVIQKSAWWIYTCPIWIKRDHSKHTLGMAIVIGEVYYLREVKTIPIGRNCKQGHPSRVARPLVGMRGAEGR